MPTPSFTIKRTPEGKIITKGGKPSCTCCGATGCPCSPDVLTLYGRIDWQDTESPFDQHYECFELTGSLCDGLFSATLVELGAVTITWSGTEWVLAGSGLDVTPLLGQDARCGTTFSWNAGPGGLYFMQIGTNPESLGCPPDCECEPYPTPTKLNVCAWYDDEFSVRHYQSFIIEGSLCDGIFINTGLSLFGTTVDVTLEWDFGTSSWSMLVGSEYYSADSPTDVRCQTDWYWGGNDYTMSVSAGSDPCGP